VARRGGASRKASNDPLMQGLLVKGADGDARRNPVLRIARDAANDMLRFAGEFGLTAAARARLGAAGWTSPGDGKFDGFLA
jgi:P27 family predicted phage terminase small subunit